MKTFLGIVLAVLILAAVISAATSAVPAYADQKPAAELTSLPADKSNVLEVAYICGDEPGVNSTFVSKVFADMGIFNVAEIPAGCIATQTRVDPAYHIEIIHATPKGKDPLKDTLLFYKAVRR